jgi:hypothetical protein
MQKKDPPIVHIKDGLIAGAITALALSIIVSFRFRADLMDLPGQVAWYLVSLLLGGAAGYAGSYLAGLLPLRLNSAIRFAMGALFGLGAFLIQLIVFMMYIFRTSNTSF